MKIEALKQKLEEALAMRDQLQNLVSGGKTQTEIAVELGMTQSNVSILMRNYEVAARGYREWPVDQIREWVEGEDRIHAWVAQQLDCSGQQVSRLCKKHGIQTAKTGSRPGKGHYAYRGGRKSSGSKPARALLRTLGFPLGPGVVVHHVNMDPSDDRLQNLWVFPDQSAHMSWHRNLEELARGSDETVEDLALQDYPPGPDLLGDAIGLVRIEPCARPSPETSAQI